MISDPVQIAIMPGPGAPPAITIGRAATRRASTSARSTAMPPRAQPVEILGMVRIPARHLFGSVICMITNL